MNIPVSVTSEPGGCIACEYPDNQRASFLVEDKVVSHTQEKEPGTRMFVGNWRDRDVYGTLDQEALKARDFDAVERLNEEMTAELAEMHRADLRKVAAGFEAHFGHPPTYLRLKLNGWIIMSPGKAGDFNLHTTSTVVALDDDIGDGQSHQFTTWDKIPALPWAVNMWGC